MSLLLYDRFVRYSMLRAALLGIMGVVTLLFPEFLINAFVYVIAGYVILNGALSVFDYILSEKASINYFNLILCCLLAVSGIPMIVYFRYLVGILPVFLGGLAMIESVVYFVIAMCTQKIKRKILIALAVLILTGGSVVVLITFGSLPTLSRVFGGVLLLSCVYELIACLIHRK